MRIGLFTDTYYPQINGVSTSVYLLKKYLELQGHEVFVCTTSDPLVTKPEHNVYRTRSLPFVSERRLGAFYSYRLSSLAAQHKPEIIHTHTEFPLGIFGRSLAHNFGIPHVHTYHTIYEEYTHFIVKFGSLDTVARSATRLMSRLFCNSANDVIVPTEKVEKLLLDYGVDRPIHVLPTGIEIDRFNPENYSVSEVRQARSEVGIAEDNFVLLNIGRVSEEKNLAEVILFTAPLLRKHDQWRLLFIGNGPELEEYKELSVTLGVGEQVIFAGARPWDNIGLYYQLGNVFVSASRSETQGLTYIESMAAGLPVLARRDPCLDLVIVEGKNGYMYDSEAEFAASIEQLAASDELRDRLSAAALGHATTFSAQQFARRMTSLYRDVQGRFTDNIIQTEDVSFRFR
ncbi:MAG: glycosyltransferase family 4 protein [Clostridiaceae bacterium]|nr:glycosyltransferase family 4 protein [Clostridiaceae bacterium]